MFLIKQNMIVTLLRKFWYIPVILVLLLSNYYTFNGFKEYKALYSEAVELNKYDKEQVEVYRLFNNKVVTQNKALSLSNKTYKNTLTDSEKKELKQRGIDPDKIKSDIRFEIVYKDSITLHFDTVTTYVNGDFKKSITFSTPDSLLSLSGELICDTSFVNCRSEFDFKILLKDGKILIYQHSPKWYKFWDWNLFRGKRFEAQADFNSSKITVRNLDVKLLNK